MIFLGPLYQPEMEQILLQNAKNGLSNAANQYQLDLLQGISANGREVKIVNVLPVGVWPKCYNKLLLTDREWHIGDYAGYEVGCINLPIIKQWMRTRRISRVLRKLTNDNDEIIIYSPYLPFLKAVKNLPSSIGVTLIVTDLPEYYDLGKTSALKRLLRKVNNYYVYKCLSRVDRYVLLTDQMKERLPVGDKPYTIVEGIWSQTHCGKATLREASGKKIVFYAGTLHRQFGIMMLIEAFKCLGRDTELWICGSGDCEDVIRAAADSDERIRFYGYVSSDEAEKLRSQATVLVNPRPNEGEYTKYSFPSKTMGYMAAGKPVVMYKLDGIPDEYDPYLIYPQDSSAEALADAIRYVIEMPKEEIVKFGKKAREFVSAQKNSKAQAGKILRMIDPL